MPLAGPYVHEDHEGAVQDIQIAKIREYFAHGDTVNCAHIGRFSSEVLATGSDDRTVNVWKLDSPRPLLSLKGHSSGVECVRFTPTEDVLISSCRDGTIRIWDLNHGGALRRAIGGQDRSTTTIDPHPFGDYFASGSATGKLEIWSSRHKKKIATYPGNSCAISVLKHSPDGQYIAVGDAMGSIKLWNLTACKLLGELPAGDRGCVSSIAFHPNDMVFAIGSETGRLEIVEIWDQEISPFVDFDISDPIKALVFNGSGDAILTANDMALNIVAADDPPIRCLAENVQTSLACLADICFKEYETVNKDPSIVSVSVQGTVVSIHSIAVPSELRFGSKLAKCSKENTSSARWSATSTSDRPSISEHHHNRDEDISDAVRFAPTTSGPDLSFAQRHSKLDGSRAFSEPEKAKKDDEVPKCLSRDRRSNDNLLADPLSENVISAAEASLMLLADHDTVVLALNFRMNQLKLLNSLWSQGRIQEALQSIIRMQDNSVASDFLAATERRFSGGALTLQLCPLLLRIIDALLASRFEDHVRTSLNSLSMLMLCYSNVIRTTRTQPMLTACDIARDERTEICDGCQAIITTSILQKIAQLAKRDGEVGTTAQGLVSKIEALL